MARRVPEQSVVALARHLLHRHHLVRLVEVLVLLARLALQRRVVHEANQVRQRPPFGDGESKGRHGEFVVLLEKVDAVLADD